MGPSTNDVMPMVVWTTMGITPPARGIPRSRRAEPEAAAPGQAGSAFGDLGGIWGLYVYRGPRLRYVEGVSAPCHVF
ncbi:hypothetical protein HMPREF1531_00481 [Propionibacterium sp. oral taxon 192 str. F0372]|nr:hypothetical protein HMPREF1531_00481 [Propionibacterium sp. oral taxon 192 str. F0372]